MSILIEPIMGVQLGFEIDNETPRQFILVDLFIIRFVFILGVN